MFSGISKAGPNAARLRVCGGLRVKTPYFYGDRECSKT